MAAADHKAWLQRRLPGGDSWSTATFHQEYLTVILPLLPRKDRHRFQRGAALGYRVDRQFDWRFCFCLARWKFEHFDLEIRETFSKIGQMSMQPDFWTIVIRAAVSGWLIALMVWLLPSRIGRFWVIIILAYVVGIAQLPHVVAGTVESFYLVSTGALGILAFDRVVRIACFHR